MNARLPLIALGVVLAGCGQAASSPRSSVPASSPPPAASAAPSPAPTRDRTLIAVAQEASPAGATIGLYTLDGRLVAQAPLPAPRAASVAGGAVTFLDGGTLKALTRDGTVETLGPAGGLPVVSPDGRQWMWSASSFGADGAVSSRLVLTTRGGPDRVIARQTAVGRSLQPFRWTAAGPTYQSAATGIGGYILFGDTARGAVTSFDPATGQVTTRLGDGGCAVGDLAADGTIACLENASLAVLSPGGHTVALPLPMPAFTQAGAVSFAPGSNTRLVIGGATSAGAAGGQERYELDVVDSGARTVRALGPAGLRPAGASWLPDGSLLAYRPAGAFGGDPGVYVVAPDGAARRVLPSGTPLGAIA
jgi:hypothetical protein